MLAVKFISKFCFILLIPLIGASPLNDVRIINGTTAIAENTGHQVSVRMRDLEYSFGKGHICGGSLITPKFVLTAAHCFYDDDIETFFDYSIYFVVMGTLDRFVRTEDTVSMDVAEIIYNGFVRPTFQNDIALMRLKEAMPDSNAMIKTIPLNKAVLPVGTVCQVTGWGQTEKGSLAKVLMTVDLPIINSTICKESYGDTDIYEEMICAGYMEGGKDACQGDSGGPMVFEGKLVGIVSFGDDCAKPGFPGVYTSVRHYIDWIQEKVGNQSLTLPDTSEDGSNIKGNSGTTFYLSSIVFLFGSLLLSSL